MKRSVLGPELIYMASCLLLLNAGQFNAESPPVLGEGFYTAGSTATPEQAAGLPAVATQSAASSAAGPFCTGDAACQQLCPTGDITRAAPPLPSSTVQQQVHRAHLPWPLHTPPHVARVLASPVHCSIHG